MGSFCGTLTRGMNMFVATHLKKILLTGTALVAVTMLPMQALAVGASGLTPNTTSSIGAATGANGAASVDNSTGEYGGDGATIDAPTIIVTGTGALLGGDGQDGPADADDSGGNDGGIGGNGLGYGGQSGTAFTTGDFTQFINNGSATGGDGGDGSDVGAGSAGNKTGGAGGNGGKGINLDANWAKLSGTGTVTGGAGGAGGDGGAGNDNGGAGGQGGSGVGATSSNVNIHLTGTGSIVTAGRGGDGGNAMGTGTAGNGGSGGYAYVAGGTGSTIVIEADAIAGDGGDGGDASGNAASTAGNGGQGGTGILLLTTGANVTINSGVTVTGGAGGAAGATNGGNAGSAGADGGALGAVFSGATITNHGTLQGGDSGNGGAVGLLASTTLFTNDGTIGGGNSGGATGDGITLLDLLNSATVTLTTLDNTGGDIDVTAGNAINLTSTNHGSAITTLTNTSGTISATSGSGILANGAIGTLTNTNGTISATTGVALNISTGGVVTSYSGVGGVITSANVTGTGSGTVVIGSTSQTALTLNGTIRNTASNNSAQAIAITAAPAGTITNGGTIRSDGTGAANSGSGVALELAAAATFTNNASGVMYGKIIDTGNVATTVTNQGAITGVITIDGNALHTFTNTGTITGAVTVSGNTTNTVNLTGGSLSSSFTGGSGADNLTLTDVTISGAVDLGGDNSNSVTVDNGSFTTSSTFTTSGRINTSVTSDGTMSIGHNYAAGAGTLGVASGGELTVTAGTFTSSGAFTSSGDTTFSGGTSTVGAITNAGTGVITLSGGSLASGAITNTGDIHITGGNLTSTGALHNTGGSIDISTGRTLSVASFTAGTGDFTFGLTAGTTTTNGTMGQLVSAAAVDLTGATIKVDPAAGFIPNYSRFKIVDGAVGAATTPSASTVTPVDVGAGNGDTATYKFYYTTGDYAGAGFGGAIGGSSQDIYIIAVRNAINSANFGASVTDQDTAVAAALDVIGASGSPALDDIQTDLANATTGAEMHDILVTLSPTVDAGVETSTLQVGAQFQGINEARMNGLRAGDDNLSGVSAGASANGNTLWAQGYGQYANQEDVGIVAGYASNIWGGAVGLDSVNIIDNGALGIAFNYGRANIRSRNANTTAGTINSYGATLYSTIPFGRTFFVNGQAGYAYNDIETVRHDVGGAGISAYGDTHSNQYSAKAEFGSTLHITRNIAFTPTVSADYVFLDSFGYEETGSGANLSVDDSTSSALDLGVGATLSWNIKSQSGATFKPSVHAAYAYDVIGDRLSTSATFAGTGGPTFTTTGADPERSTINAGGGFAFTSEENWTLSTNYNYEYRQDFAAHSGVLKMSVSF